MKGFIVLLLALLGAGGAQGNPGNWTAGVVEEPGAGEPVSLVAVRTGRHRDFDRVVFEFADTLPGYRLAYVDRPVRACGSGKPVPLPGEGWLAVRLVPARAHDAQGTALVQTDRRELDYPLLRALVRICDFEGRVEWVLALAEPNRYRVLTLDHPPRLVVDVRH